VIFLRNYDHFLLLDIGNPFSNKYILVKVLEFINSDDLANLEYFTENDMILLVQIKQFRMKNHFSLFLCYMKTVLYLLFEPILEFLNSRYI